MFRGKGPLGWVAIAILVFAGSALGAPGSSGGRLSGIVVDPAGTPQMGATVLVQPEQLGRTDTLQLLTGPQGVFRGESLAPGFYTVRVTLAGFLPTLQQHVRVSANLTTLLRVELSSVFASLDRLRRTPPPQTDADEWKWVLRTSAATRPVLQWVDGEVVAANERLAAERKRQRKPRARIELTSGPLHAGLPSSFADAPATAFAYEQNIGYTSQLLLAGQVGYDGSSPAAGLATVWLPTGQIGDGPATTLVLRQSRLGPNGLTYRRMRLSQTNQTMLGSRALLRYGAEYVMVGLGRSTSSLRPAAELEMNVSPNWRASVRVAADPGLLEDSPDGRLQSALGALDEFPVVLWRNSRPVLAGGWHEEVAVERRLNSRARLQGAVFHDRSSHVAVFGRGGAPNPDYLRDFFSDAFAYDGGESGSWGARLAYEQKLSQRWQVEAVYAWGGALAVEDTAEDSDLRGALVTRYHQSLAARISGHMPRVGTQFAASYKWVSGSAVSRLDSYGERAYKLDPYLSLRLRQPLPVFLLNGRWEALADFQNLLAQGYVPVNSRDGRILLLPAMRTIRGGVSFQF